jgi:hypothetical protein
MRQHLPSILRQQHEQLVSDGREVHLVPLHRDLPTNQIDPQRAELHHLHFARRR